MCYYEETTGMTTGGAMNERDRMSHGATAGGAGDKLCNGNLTLRCQAFEKELFQLRGSIFQINI